MIFFPKAFRSAPFLQFLGGTVRFSAVGDCPVRGGLCRPCTRFQLCIDFIESNFRVQPFISVLMLYAASLPVFTLSRILPIPQTLKYARQTLLFAPQTNLITTESFQSNRKTNGKEWYSSGRGVGENPALHRTLR